MIINSIIYGSGEVKNQDKTINENGIYTADSGYTGLGTVTVNVPQSGDVVEAIALGSAKDSVENDKVLLNPSISLQKETEAEYTPYVGMADTSQTSYYPMGCLSAKYGKMFSYGSSNSFQPFTYDYENNKYIGGSKETFGGFYPLIWGTNDQLYYINIDNYDRTQAKDWGLFNSENFSTQPLDGEKDVFYFQGARFYKNYLAGYTALISGTGFFRIDKTGIVRCSRTDSKDPLGIIPFNDDVYCIVSNTSMYSMSSKEVIISGLSDNLLTNPTISSLDSTGSYFIAGSFGVPDGAKIFKKSMSSTEENLILEEVKELSNILPISSGSGEFCIQVDPVTETKSFADIFIRYNVGELYYLQWDGENLINYGKIGDDKVYYFSFNPYDRILITNKSKSTDPVNTVDYHIYSFQNIMNKEFTATEITAGNWSQDTLTGFVKSNKGVDEFGNTILEVSTTTDPTQEPWTDVGKVFGFNVSLEKGEL